MTTIILPKKDRDRVIKRLFDFLYVLPDKEYRIEVIENRRTRSQSQNNYLWGVCYVTILREAGEQLAGWHKQDLHEWFLGEWSGWERLEGLGKVRMRPISRSKALSTVDFSAYIAFIHEKASKMGIYIPDPQPELVSCEQ